MFSGVIPACLALHSISQAGSLCLAKAAAGDSAPVSAVLPVPRCWCQPVLGELLLLLLLALFIVEDELGRAFPTLCSDLM